MIEDSGQVVDDQYVVSQTSQRFEVDKILDARKHSRTGQYEYLVDWKRWPGESTWEPMSHIEEYRGLVKEFEARRKKYGSSSAAASASQSSTKRKVSVDLDDGDTEEMDEEYVQKKWRMREGAIRKTRRLGQRGKQVHAGDDDVGDGDDEEEEEEYIPEEAERSDCDRSRVSRIEEEDEEEEEQPQGDREEGVSNAINVKQLQLTKNAEAKKVTTYVENFNLEVEMEKFRKEFAKNYPDPELLLLNEDEDTRHTNNSPASPSHVSPHRKRLAKRSKPEKKAQEEMKSFSEATEAVISALNLPQMEYKDETIESIQVEITFKYRINWAARLDGSMQDPAELTHSRTHPITSEQLIEDLIQFNMQ